MSGILLELPKQAVQSRISLFKYSFSSFCRI